MTRIPASERRAALVQAAVQVIARGGVSAATTRAIVAEAGMSLASFHYVFASHDELMAEVVTWVIEGEQGAILPDDLPAAGLRDLVHGALHRYFDLLKANPNREQAVNELALHALRTPAWNRSPGASTALPRPRRGGPRLRGAALGQRVGSARRRGRATARRVHRRPHPVLARRPR